MPINQVQKTFIQQLQVQNPNFLSEFHITNIVLMSENRIRLHHRAKEIVNIDITYNRGSDLYDVKAYCVRNHGLDVQTIFDEEGFFWDQLNTVIKSILKTPKLECKLCGEILPNRSVKGFMEHLELEHNAEFVDRVEAIFYKKIEA